MITHSSTANNAKSAVRLYAAAYPGGIYVPCCEGEKKSRALAGRLTIAQHKESANADDAVLGSRANNNESPALAGRLRLSSDDPEVPHFPKVTLFKRSNFNTDYQSSR